EVRARLIEHAATDPELSVQLAVIDAIQGAVIDSFDTNDRERLFLIPEILSNEPNPTEILRHVSNKEGDLTWEVVRAISESGKPGVEAVLLMSMRAHERRLAVGWDKTRCLPTFHLFLFC